MFWCGRCETQGEHIEIQLAEGEESGDLSNGMLIYMYGGGWSNPEAILGSNPT